MHNKTTFINRSLRYKYANPGLADLKVGTGLAPLSTNDPWGWGGGGGGGFPHRNPVLEEVRL